MAVLLAIETATEAFSIGLQVGHQRLLHHEVAPRAHARLLLPTIARLLAQAGIARSAIDAIAVGRGPGAFTGVRIAIAAAQGLGLGLNRPLLPISTLAILAQSSAAPGASVFAAIDARMQEIYAAVFTVAADGCVQPRDPECCVLATDWQPIHDIGAIGVGSAFAAWPTLLPGVPRDPSALPHVRDLLQLASRDFAAGLGIDAALAQPVYLRNDVAKKSVHVSASGVHSALR
jgi:tRNA threonylcarbamoyladenosine biosynthesis protein TsaB